MTESAKGLTREDLERYASTGVIPPEKWRTVFDMALRSLESSASATEPPKAWEWPCDTVGQLIANLQTLPPEMPFYTAYFVKIGEVSVAKTTHPSISRETVEKNRVQKYDASKQSLVMWAHVDERTPLQPASTAPEEKTPEHPILVAALDTLAAQDAACLDWLEENHTLHKGVEILYVVDGYQVTLMHEDGVTELSPRFEGHDLRSAIGDAMRHDMNGGT